MLLDPFQPELYIYLPKSHVIIEPSMSKKKTLDFIWGIVGSLVASLMIAIANILFGRFSPNFPREILDVFSIILPLLIILIYLYREKIKKVHIRPSIIIVTIVTMFLIVGFGVSIRWLFEQRTAITMPYVVNSYRQIYDILAP